MAQVITALGDTAGMTHGTMEAMPDGMTLGIWDGTIRGTTEDGTAHGILGIATITGTTIITMLAGTEVGIHIGDTTITTTELLSTPTTRTDGTAQEEPQVLTACSPATQASEAVSAAEAQ